MIHKIHEKHVFFHFFEGTTLRTKNEKNVYLPSKILYCMRIFHNTKIWIAVFNNRLPGELSNLWKSGTLKKNAHIYIHIQSIMIENIKIHSTRSGLYLVVFRILF